VTFVPCGCGERRRAAMALVKEGVPVSLAANAFTEKAADVPCPAEWAMTSASQTGATDRVAFPCIHGAASTHIDSLAHTFFRGKMWNGYDTSALVTKEKGAEKNSVLTMKNGIVTRAVLYDIARLKGVSYLAPVIASLPRTWRLGKRRRVSGWRRGTRWCFAGAAMGGEPSSARTTAPPGSIIQSFRG
jgi:hypothetical protein